MKWARAKTIFIYIFLFVNLFLFAVYRMNSFEGKQADTENVAAVLTHYKISADPSVFGSLPEKMPRVEVTDLSSNPEFIEKLFGTTPENKNGVFTAGSKSYDPANGKFTDSAPEDKSFSKLSEGNAEKKIISCFDHMGFNKKEIYPVSVSTERDGRISVVTGYEYSGYPIFEASVKTTASEKGIEEMKGKFYSLSPVEGGSYKVSPPESVLLDYLSFYGNKYGKELEIKEIRCGYFIPTEAGTVSSHAIPAYEFIFSDKVRLCLDGRENIVSEYKILSESEM